MQTGTQKILDLRNESILVHTMTILVVSGAPKLWVAMIFREWDVAIRVWNYTTAGAETASGQES